MTKLNTSYLNNFRKFELSKDLMEPSVILKTVIPIFEYELADEDYTYPHLQKDTFETDNLEDVHSDLCKLFWTLNSKNQFFFQLQEEDVEFIEKLHPGVVAIMARAFWDVRLAEFLTNDKSFPLFYRLYVLYIRDYDEKWNEILEELRETEKENPFIRFWYSKLLYRGNKYDLSNLI
jgi:hypothetical protein